MNIILEEKWKRAIWRRLGGWPFCLGIAISGLGACATGPRIVDHAFEFDMAYEAPAVELLDYAYGNSYSGTRATDWEVRERRVKQQRGVDGAIPLGDFLYVKWRLKETGEVFEDKVDLRSRLPADIARHTIYFSIKGKQLVVYLVTPNKRRSGTATAPLRKYSDLEVIEIYPAQPNF